MSTDENVSDSVKLAALKDAVDRAGLSPRHTAEVEVAQPPWQAVFSGVAHISRETGRARRGLLLRAHVITHGMQRIRAHLELSGDELHVHANSEARFERVLATIRALDPSVTVLRETREPAGDYRAVQRLAARSSATPATFIDPAANPAIAAALEEMARKYEAAWLDEPIPALAGHTPRECANDPTRRSDLIQLLDSFRRTPADPAQ